MTKKSSEERVAFKDAFGIYYDLEYYIDSLGGRFFFNSFPNSGILFFEELKKLISKQIVVKERGKSYFRARIVECKTGHCQLDDDTFEGFTESEFGAPPDWKSSDGRVNPKGVSCLYLSETRKCALAEVRPNISSLVAIAEGKLGKDVTLVSFANLPNQKFSLMQQELFKIVSSLFSAPLNGQYSTEYLPSQVISEFIKFQGYDGVEYNSAQEKNGLNIALFDTTLWSADYSRVFEVTNISYSAVRERGHVEIMGCPDEEL